MEIHSEQEMLTFGQDLAKKITPPAVIELIGDVGAGKTTLVRGFAKGLGVKEPITSPSFTISKTYALPTGGQLIHYDFYRLDDPGIMLDDLTENLKNPQNLIIIEWGASVANILPPHHHRIQIDYTDTGRKVTL